MKYLNWNTSHPRSYKMSHRLRALLKQRERIEAAKRNATKNGGAK